MRLKEQQSFCNLQQFPVFLIFRNHTKLLFNTFPAQTSTLPNICYRRLQRDAGSWMNFSFLIQSSNVGTNLHRTYLDITTSIIRASSTFYSQRSAISFCLFKKCCLKSFRKRLTIFTATSPICTNISHFTTLSRSLDLVFNPSRSHTGPFWITPSYLSAIGWEVQLHVLFKLVIVLIWQLLIIPTVSSSPLCRHRDVAW